MKRNLLIVTLLLVLFVPTIVLADSFKFDAKVNQEGEAKVYKENDEIIINLEVSEINAGEDGINTIEGILEYDEDLFEVVKSSDFKGKNEWSFTYNEGTTGEKGKFLGIIISSGVKEKQEIGTITLKVRNEVKKSAISTSIKIKDIKTSNGVEIIKTEDKTIDLPLNVEYKGNNPAGIIIVFIAITAIVLGLFAISRKK